MGTIILIVIGSIVCFCYGREHVGDFGELKKMKKSEHVEMVEDNMNSDLEENKNQMGEKKIGGDDYINDNQ
jgi:hypothetical protein